MATASTATSSASGEGVTMIEPNPIPDVLEAAERDLLAQRENKITIIAWGGDLDRIWPTLILSTTAAASGMQASVFFTFWGLFALVRPGVRITGTNWMQKMMSVMNPGTPARAKLSRYNFAGIGPGMMKKLARDYKTPSPTELLEMAREMGVRLIPCQMTMELM